MALLVRIAGLEKRLEALAKVYANTKHKKTPKVGLATLTDRKSLIQDSLELPPKEITSHTIELDKIERAIKSIELSERN